MILYSLKNIKSFFNQHKFVPYLHRRVSINFCRVSIPLCLPLSPHPLHPLFFTLTPRRTRLPASLAQPAPPIIFYSHPTPHPPTRLTRPTRFTVPTHPPTHPLHLLFLTLTPRRTRLPAPAPPINFYSSPTQHLPTHFTRPTRSTYSAFLSPHLAPAPLASSAFHSFIMTLKSRQS
jgi:hypothetical protein